MNERRRLIDEFNDLFDQEAALRSQRDGYTENTHEPIWVIKEAEAMLKRINEHRLVREKKPLTKERYERMEVTCMGHCDYQQKLALGSMELVLDEN